ncbi:MAG: prolyl oligopeptidase family serine peptidase, partial [Candidatus Hydrogenedentes bacterium]|nr:prolyl oligopeptidase family serine peptidase [Candidatus Hydrogenedentota bacterium]
PPAPPPYDDTPLRRAAHAAIVDTKAALRYVRANSTEYGVDPALIAVFGESAGAIAAMGAAMTGDNLFVADRPDLPVPEENSPAVSSGVCAAVEFWGNGEEILPNIDATDPPLMIVHGTADEYPGTPFSAAQALAETCKTQGLPHEFHALEGEGHGAWGARLAGLSLADLAYGFLATASPLQ